MYSRFRAQLQAIANPFVTIFFFQSGTRVGMKGALVIVTQC